MKKLVFIGIIMLSTINLFAIEEKLQKIYGNEENAIYTNILSFLFKEVNITYERLIENKYSLVITAGASDAAPVDVSNSSDWSFLTTILKFGFSVYPAGRYGNTLRGFYFMPNYTIINIDAKYKPQNISGTNLAHKIGVNFGYKWILNKVVFDLSAGFGYRTAITVKAGSIEAGSCDHKVGLTYLGLHFGYSW
mgnify:CR=1 FL=1